MLFVFTLFPILMVTLDERRRYIRTQGRVVYYTSDREFSWPRMIISLIGLAANIFGLCFNFISNPGLAFAAALTAYLIIAGTCILPMALAKRRFY